VSWVPGCKFPQSAEGVAGLELVGNVEVWPYVQAAVASEENAIDMQVRSNGI
jgi:hypothetical protein